MNLEWFPVLFIVFYQQCHANEANCTSAGRFPNDLSNDCRRFTMCLMVLDSFTRIDLICPKHSIYSHVENQCTNITSYRCFPEYNCTEVGDFPNPSVNDCSSYVSCSEGMGSLVTARITDCPPEMVYNPAERACVNTTVFQCVVTTTEPPKVFEVSVKVSPDPGRVNSTNSAYNKKIDYMLFMILLIVCLLNKILI